MKLYLPLFGKFEIRNLVLGYLLLAGLFKEKTAIANAENSSTQLSERDFQLACVKGIEHLKGNHLPSPELMLSALKETGIPGIRGSTFLVESRFISTHSNLRDEEYTSVISDGYTIYGREKGIREIYQKEPFNNAASNRPKQLTEIRIEDQDTHQSCHRSFHHSYR